MNKKYTYLIIIFLIVASCAAFGRIAGNDFINFDDTGYITDNYFIQQGINLQTIKWAFTAIVVSNWHPLTLLSHMLDWSLFGANAGGHHIVSLLLHIGAVIFLFLFLNKTTNSLWPSAFAAAFFALHPLRVESVAWAAERKDVLSMFFGMTTLYVYAFYAESAKLSRYFLCLILFALSLMSKPMLVTLPFVLMLLDYWPLGRWQKTLDEQGKSFNPVGRLIWEKIPFICLTIAASIITFWTQNKVGTVTPMEHLHFPTRIVNAIIAYVSYLGKTLGPVDLAVFYPYEIAIPLWKILISGFVLILITAAVLYYIKKLPFLFVGWFWYLGTLIPVIGLVQVGMQSMADRYTYLPSIGIAMMLAWGIPFVFPREDVCKKILFPVGVTVIAILAILTWRQCGYWKNNFTLFSHAVRVTENNNLAHDNRGSAYAELGQYQRAIDDFNKAIRLKPDDAMAYFNKGNVYGKLGQYQLAIENFSKAIGLKKDYANAYNNRGNIYGQHGQYQLAIEDFNKVIELNATHIRAYNNRGLAYSELGQYQRAIEDFNKAIDLQQDYTEAYKNRANAYFNQGNNISGCNDAKKSCELGNCKIWKSSSAKLLCK